MRLSKNPNPNSKTQKLKNSKTQKLKNSKTQNQIEFLLDLVLGNFFFFKKVEFMYMSGLWVGLGWVDKKKFWFLLDCGLTHITDEEIKSGLKKRAKAHEAEIEKLEFGGIAEYVLPFLFVFFLPSLRSPSLPSIIFFFSFTPFHIHRKTQKNKNPSKENKRKKIVKNLL